LRIKTRWAPAACLLGRPEALAGQSIADVDVFEGAVSRRALAASLATAFVIPQLEQAMEPRAVEKCALAVWSGRAVVSVGGAVGVSRAALGRIRTGGRLAIEFHQELARRGWLRESHPVQDLETPLEYWPCRPKDRRCAAVLVAHLERPGAVLAAARALRGLGEVLVLATDRSSRGRTVWSEAAEGVYDLAELVQPVRLPLALYSMVAAWKFDVLVVAGSRLAYGVLPDLRRASPGIRIVEVVERELDWDEEWAAISSHADPDVRVVVSGAGDFPSGWKQIFSSESPLASRTLLLAGEQLADFSAGPDRFHTAGEPELAVLPPVELRFGEALEATGLRLSEQQGVVTLEIQWRCCRPVGRPLRCFAHLVDATGPAGALDHELLRGTPPLQQWKPGDAGYEARQLILPPGRGAGLKLHFGLFDAETGLRLPVQVSSVPLADDYTAAAFEPNQTLGRGRVFAMEAAPRTPCRVEFEGGPALLGYSWRVQQGLAWLRLWWEVRGPAQRPLSFFGHGVSEASAASPILTSFDQELGLERMREVPEVVGRDVVRHLPGSGTSVRWLRAGIFDLDGSLERLPVVSSTVQVSHSERAVYLALGPRS
jgi:hypothetical protein